MKNILINPPLPGEILYVTPPADAHFLLMCSQSDFTLIQSGDALVFSFENGGHITVKDFFSIFDMQSLPDFTMDGTLVAGSDFLTAYAATISPATGFETQSPEQGCNFMEGSNLEQDLATSGELGKNLHEMYVSKMPTKDFSFLTITKDTQLNFDFDPEHTSLMRIGNNLIISFNEGGKAILKDFYLAYDADNMPNFIVENTKMRGEEFFERYGYVLSPAAILEPVQMFGGLESTHFMQSTHSAAQHTVDVNALQDMVISQPAAGELVFYAPTSDARLVLDFDPTGATLIQSGESLVFSFENGSHVTLKNFYAIYDDTTLPDFLIDGVEVTGHAFFSSFEQILFPAAGTDMPQAAEHAFATPAQSSLDFMEYADAESVLHGMDLASAQAPVQASVQAPIQEGIVQELVLTRPAAGEITSFTPQGDVQFILEFNPADVLFLRDGDNLTMSFNDGAHIVVENFYTTFSSTNMPSFIIENAYVAGEDFFNAFNADLMPEANMSKILLQNGASIERVKVSLLKGLNSLQGLEQVFVLSGIVASKSVITHLDTGEVAPAASPVSFTSSTFPASYEEPLFALVPPPPQEPVSKVVPSYPPSVDTVQDPILEELLATKNPPAEETLEEAVQPEILAPDTLEPPLRDHFFPHTPDSMVGESLESAPTLTLGPPLLAVVAPRVPNISVPFEPDIVGEAVFIPSNALIAPDALSPPSDLGPPNDLGPVMPNEPNAPDIPENPDIPDMPDVPDNPDDPVIPQPPAANKIPSLDFTHSSTEKEILTTYDSIADAAAAADSTPHTALGEFALGLGDGVTTITVQATTVGVPQSITLQIAEDGTVLTPLAGVSLAGKHGTLSHFTYENDKITYIYTQNGNAEHNMSLGEDLVALDTFTVHIQDGDAVSEDMATGTIEIHIHDAVPSSSADADGDGFSQSAAILTEISPTLLRATAQVEVDMGADEDGATLTLDLGQGNAYTVGLIWSTSKGVWELFTNDPDPPNSVDATYTPPTLSVDDVTLQHLGGHVWELTYTVPVGIAEGARQVGLVFTDGDGDAVRHTVEARPLQNESVLYTHDALDSPDTDGDGLARSSSGSFALARHEGDRVTFVGSHGSLTLTIHSDYTLSFDPSNSLEGLFGTLSNFRYDGTNLFYTYEQMRNAHHDATLNEGEITQDNFTLQVSTNAAPHVLVAEGSITVNISDDAPQVDRVNPSVHDTFGEGTSLSALVFDVATASYWAKGELDVHFGADMAHAKILLNLGQGDRYQVGLLWNALALGGLGAWEVFNTSTDALEPVLDFSGGVLTAQVGQEIVKLSQNSEQHWEVLYNLPTGSRDVTLNFVDGDGDRVSHTLSQGSWTDFVSVTSIGSSQVQWASSSILGSYSTLLEYHLDKFTVDVGSGNDNVHLGDGNDIIYLGESYVEGFDDSQGVPEELAAAYDILYRYMEGEDSVHFLGLNPTEDSAIKEFSENVPFVDTAHGGGGNDTIYGEEGIDLIFAGAGDDIVYGGDGDDGLRGGSGDDMLYGDAGQDILHGGSGHDILDGGAGDDLIYAGVEDIRVVGGTGSDLIRVDGLSMTDVFEVHGDALDALENSAQDVDILITNVSSTGILEDLLQSGKIAHTEVIVRADGLAGNTTQEVLTNLHLHQDSEGHFDPVRDGWKLEQYVGDYQGFSNDDDSIFIFMHTSLLHG